MAYMKLPEHLALRVTTHSQAPPGAGTGTSAAVTVALLGALDLLTEGCLSPREVAYAAHAVETQVLKQQSGIQDQLCAAFGGINFIDVPEYPHAVLKPIHVSDDVWWELGRRLVLIYLGSSHSSSQLHEKVIRDLQDLGPDCGELDDLRLAAEKAHRAVEKGDLDALGRSMQANTDAQARLHPDLVSHGALRVIDIARAHGALGWKVNGAGGRGGSVTLLCGALSRAKRAMIRDIEQEESPFQNIPIHLSRHGLRVWERELGS